MLDVKGTSSEVVYPSEHAPQVREWKGFVRPDFDFVGTFVEAVIDSYASVILPSIFRPFAVFMLVQQMRTVPVDYLDAARVDGANIFQVYSRVALPLCAPTLATLAVTTFMESWNDYLWPLLMLTDRAKMTLPIALSTLNGQYNTEYNVLMAGSLISMIPIIIIYLFAQKHFKNGLMAGGIKG